MTIKKIIMLGVNTYSKKIEEVLMTSYVYVEKCPHDEKEFAEVICQAQKERKDYEYFIGFEDNAFRKLIDQKYDVKWCNSICDKNIVFGKRVRTGGGTFYMTNVTINNDVHVGRHCIIGSGTILDRDCVIGNYVNIDLGVVVEREATIGDSVHIGTRVTVLEGIHIADDCEIAPGTIVSEDIAKPGTKYGFLDNKHIKQ